MDSPILLINLNGKVSDPTSEFAINDTAVKIIESMDAPIGIISVAGLYRTGKSFILNQLAGRTDGFDIGSSIQPQTQGIWMWALDKETLKRRQLPHDMNIILLDTEGLGSFTKTETHDVKIFALAVLLSSYLIYNSLGTIDDNAVENMSLIVNLTKSIREKVIDSDESSVAVDPVSLRHFFPRFLWLLRDFSLELKLDGRRISENEYLEHALRPLEGSEQEIAIKNKVRQTIKSVFHQRSCYTLKRPVDDEDDLQSLGSLPLSQFRPDYIDEVKRLIQLIYQNTPPKSLYGTNFSGPVLVAIMRQYVNSINSGSVPVISSAWESVLAQKTESAIQDAKALIDNMQSKVSHDLDDHMDLVGPNGILCLAEQEGFDLFLQTAVLNAMTPAQLRAFLERIHLHASESGLKLMRSIIDRCSQTNTEMATKIMRQVKHAIDQAQSIADIKLATETGISDYTRNAKGNNSNALLFDAGWTSLVLAGASQVSAAEAIRINRENHERYEVEIEKSNSKYATLQELYETVEKEWQKEQNNAKTFREQATDLRYEIINQEKQIKTLESEMTGMIELKNDLDSKLEAMTCKFKTEEEVRSHLEQELIEMTKKYYTAEDMCKDLSSRLDDVLTNKTSPSSSIDKESLLKEIESRKMTNDALRTELNQAYEIIEMVKKESGAKAQQFSKEKIDTISKTKGKKADPSDVKCKCTIM